MKKCGSLTGGLEVSFSIGMGVCSCMSPVAALRECHYILTSTKNASLIITDFLAMIYKNEKPRTASLCRGWAMLENDFNFICR